MRRRGLCAGRQDDDRIAMKRTWTIIGVSDVASSLRWYQSLFGQPQTPPAHEDFASLIDEPGPHVPWQRAPLVL
jgi:hypothetical protein